MSPSCQTPAGAIFSTPASAAAKRHYPRLVCALPVLSVFPLLQTADEPAAHAGDLQLISYQTIQIE